jgi:hypothetical protein
MNRRFIVLLVAFLLVADALVVGVVFWVVRDLEEPLLVPEREAELERALAEKDRELGRLREELAGLREARSGLRAQPDEEAEAEVGESGSGSDRSGIVESTLVPIETAPGDASTEGEGKPAVDYAAFARKVLKMAKLAQEAGNKPTPELMRMVSEMMQDTAALQARYGFDEPGYVTESPEFKAHFLINALDETETPFSPAEKARILEDAKQAMDPYVAAARSRPGDFALEKTARVLETTGGFGESMGKMMEGRKLEGPLFSNREKEEDGSGRHSPWPSQSCTGVKDLEDAVDKLTKRWGRKMGIPGAEVPSLQGLVRDYVHRSHDARLRYGSGPEGKLTPSERKALDRELASFQVDALKRIHGSLNLDEKTKKKVAGYQSLDRFEIGSTESWSRSGSFGNFVVNAGGEEHVEERSEEK